MDVCVFLCCVVLYRYRPCAGLIHPPAKESYQTSNGSKKLKQEPRIIIIIIIIIIMKAEGSLPFSQGQPLVSVLRHESIPGHILLIYILILFSNLRLCPPRGVSSQFFRQKFNLFHAYYMLRLSHPPWSDHLVHIWWGIKRMKLLIIRVSPHFYYILSLRSKYASQYPVLKHPHAM
jgi:hypothetical protein